MKKFGFGLMRLPVTEEGNPKSIDLNQVEKMTDAFLEAGFTYFDTAYPYHQGMSEVAAGKALVSRHERSTFTLTSKMPISMVAGASDYDKFFSEQLSRTGAGYFDYYMLHNLGERNYEATEKFGGFEFIQKLKRDGLIRQAGFSFHDKAEALDKYLTDHPEVDFVQLQINYVDWTSEAIESRKNYEIAVKHKKPVIVMEPVKGGVLAQVPEEAGKMFKQAQPNLSVPSWALRFAASLDSVFMVLSGMSTFSQMEDNLNTMRNFQPLSEGEQELIGRVREIIIGATAIPCTACQYCVDGCPQSIPIPRFFSLYNNIKQFGFNPALGIYYLNLIEKNAKASECIECGQCEEHCPQHIRIIDELKNVAVLLEEKK